MLIIDTINFTDSYSQYILTSVTAQVRSNPEQNFRYALRAGTQLTLLRNVQMRERIWTVLFQQFTIFYGETG